MNKFAALGLSTPLVSALEAMGFEEPTQIQEKAIPLLIEGNIDFIGLAQTGTGKTAAFGLPALELVSTETEAIQTLVLAPTRELGLQITEQLKDFSKKIKGINIQAVYGGAAITNQIRALKNVPQVLVATPGRLVDLIKRKKIDLSEVSRVVLDEADEMLNMGFKDDLDFILSHVPESKYTWLFSATMPKEIQRLIKRFMDNPVEVKINTGNVVNENIEHQYIQVRRDDKEEVLKRIIDINPDMIAVVFCRTKADTQNLANTLTGHGYSVEALHGDLTQQQRERVMGRFKNHAIKIITATDVAARGIDVNDLTHVIHYSLPDDNEYYTHRSGRTARAGKKGISIAFASGRDMGKIRMLQRNLKITFNQVTPPSNASIISSRMLNWVEQLKLAAPKPEFDENLLAHVVNAMDGLEGEDLMRHLIQMQINQMGISKKEIKPENERKGDREGRNDRDRDGRRGRDRDERRNSRDRDRDGKRDRRDRDDKKRDRGDRKEKSRDYAGDSDGSNVFFINVGTMDGVTKSELKQFVSDFTEIEQNNVHVTDVQNKMSFFEVKNASANQVLNGMSDLKVDGRSIKVNLEKPQKKSYHKKRR